MTDQETINNEVQIRLAIHDEKFNAFIREMQNFKDEMQNFRDEMKDFKDEMRQQNQIRSEEMREMREENNKIREEIRGMGRYIQSLAITSMVGIGGIAAAVIYSVWKH